MAIRPVRRALTCARLTGRVATYTMARARCCRAHSGPNIQVHPKMQLCWSSLQMQQRFAAQMQPHAWDSNFRPSQWRSPQGCVAGCLQGLAEGMQLPHEPCVGISCRPGTPQQLVCGRQRHAFVCAHARCFE